MHRELFDASATAGASNEFLEDEDKSAEWGKSVGTFELPRLPFAVVCSVALIGAVLLPASAISALAAVLLLPMVVVAALVPARITERPTSMLLWFPMALFALAGLLLAACMAARALGLGLWSTRSGALVVNAVVIGASLLVAQRKRRYPLKMVVSDIPGTSMGCVVLGIGVYVLGAQPFEVWSRIVSGGTDFTRHLEYSRQIGVSGGVDFGFGFPASINMLVGWLGQATLSEWTLRSAWSLGTGVAWALLTLAVVAGATMAAHVTYGVTRSTPASVGSGYLASLILIQSSIFGAQLSEGFLSTIALCALILAFFTVILDPAFRGWLGAGISCLAVGMIANTWQLFIPAISAAFLNLLLARRFDLGRLVSWLAMVPGALIAASMVWAYSPLGDELANSTPAAATVGTTASGLVALLRYPGRTALGLVVSWWWLAMLLAIFALIWGWRCELRSWAISFGAFLVVGAVTLVGILALTGETWGTILYYPSKYLAVYCVPIAPLAAAGAAIALRGTLRRSRELGLAELRTTATAALMGSVVICAISYAGWASALRPNVVTIISGSPTIPPLQIPLVETLSTLSAEHKKRGAVALGILPFADWGQRMSANLDYAVSESLYWAGFDTGRTMEFRKLVLGNDGPAMCRWLGENPDVIRVGANNRRMSLDWLTENGCPDRSVMPENWIWVDIDDSWFDGTPAQGWESEVDEAPVK